MSPLNFDGTPKVGRADVSFTSPFCWWLNQFWVCILCGWAYCWFALAISGGGVPGGSAPQLHPSDPPALGAAGPEPEEVHGAGGGRRLHRGGVGHRAGAVG